MIQKTMLQLPIEEYFRYHPPTTPERQQKHALVNDASLQYCQALLEWPHGENLIASITTIQDAAKSVCTDETCLRWAMSAIDRAWRSSGEGDDVGVLMHVQQARMFLNQGVTIDELIAKQNAH
jgi:hypothetical protein